ncbi:MAG: SpoIID/LytB domain-containing protein [bacterium]|nr:SpoIID/LytB domain-containing protein [bacterium]
MSDCRGNPLWLPWEEVSLSGSGRITITILAVIGIILSTAFTGFSDTERMIRVGLSKGLTKASLSASDWRLYDGFNQEPVLCGKGEIVFQIVTAAAPEASTPAASDTDITVAGAMIKTVSSAGVCSRPGPFRLVPDGPSQVIAFAGKRYRGLAEVRSDGKGRLTVINVLPLEQYLYGVINCEMPASWNPEALKAQAVVARTYALKNVDKHRAESFDLCNDVHCQVYGGLDREHANGIRAVRETEREILTWDGQPIDSVFHASCGGYTEDAGNVWVGDIPYLKAAPCSTDEPELLHFPLNSLYREFFPIGPWLSDYPQALCRRSGTYRWHQVLTMPQAERVLKDKVPLLSGRSGTGKLMDIRVTGRSQAGRVTALDIVCSNGIYKVERDRIRSFLGGLKSTLFVIRTVYDKDGRALAFGFEGGGWGHGVGLCQTGADGLARVGWSYDRILKHYYRGVTLEKESETCPIFP